MTIVNIVLLMLTIISGLAALLFVVRGLQMRSTQASYPYGVAKQDARHEMQVNFLRAGFLLLLTLILLGIYGLVPSEDSPASLATATATLPPTQTRSESTATATPAREATPTAEPTVVELTATAALTMTATVATTPTPSVPTALVNSPNGLWLREAPGGSQEVELIAHESELVLLTGRETADDIEWQQVRTPAGNEGWVAVEFLIYQ